MEIDQDRDSMPGVVNKIISHKFVHADAHVQISYMLYITLLRVSCCTIPCLGADRTLTVNPAETGFELT